MAQAQVTKPASVKPAKSSTKPASVKPAKSAKSATKPVNPLQAELARRMTEERAAKAADHSAHVKAHDADLTAKIEAAAPGVQLRAAKDNADQLAKAQADTKPLAYFVRDSARPGAGSKLFAYTMAWLQASGLIDGGSIPRAHALKVAGQTAIQYHTTRTLKLIDKAGMIELAPGAANFFADRHHDAKEREAYRTILTTGEPDGSLIKQAGAIGKLAA